MQKKITIHREMSHISYSLELVLCASIVTWFLRKQNWTYILKDRDVDLWLLNQNGFTALFITMNARTQFQKLKNLPIFVKMSEATDHILCKVLVNILLNIYEGLCRIIKAQ